MFTNNTQIRLCCVVPLGLCVFRLIQSSSTELKIYFPGSFASVEMIALPLYVLFHLNIESGSPFLHEY